MLSNAMKSSLLAKDKQNKLDNNRTLLDLEAFFRLFSFNQK